MSSAFGFNHLISLRILLIFYSVNSRFSLYGDQELKIEGEQQELMEEDDLDLMLPAKKKKAKKVEFVEESDTLEKDDGIKIDTICYYLINICKNK